MQIQIKIAVAMEPRRDPGKAGAEASTASGLAAAAGASHGCYDCSVTQASQCDSSFNDALSINSCLDGTAPTKPAQKPAKLVAGGGAPVGPS